MRKPILFFCSLLLSLAAWATPYVGSESMPEAVNVHHFDATIHSTMLDNVQSITFNDDETIMTLTETDATTQDFALVDILYVAFGAYISQDNPSTPIETTPYIVSPDGVQKVLENGQLIIIKNGVRYSVLGVRL